jgi:ATP-dependent protease HslVU (ClpYQ) peptidase subunit
LIRHSPLEAPEVVQQAMEIAAELDIYTNKEIIMEELKN